MSLINDLIQEINSKLAGSAYIIIEQPREEYWIKQYSVLINGYLYMSILIVNLKKRDKFVYM